jgi:hypothetical protein
LNVENYKYAMPPFIVLSVILYLITPVFPENPVYLSATGSYFSTIGSYLSPIDSYHRP